MLQLPKFGHTVTSAILFESRDKILLVTSWTKIMTLQTLFQNTFLLKSPRVANFCDIVKIATTFVKTSIKNLREFKIIY